MTIQTLTATPAPMMAARHSLSANLAGLPPDAILTTSEAAAYCGIGGSTWEKMRARGETPGAIKLTSRTLGYRKRTLDQWLDGRCEGSAA